MKTKSLFRDYFVVWVLLGGLILGAALFAIFGLLVFSMRPTPADSAGVTTPVVTVIAAPTLTLMAAIPTEIQPTPKSETTATPRIGGEIAVGMYVKITGTSGEGLRIRSGPGTQSSMLFLGMDEEVFLVKDGPRDANDLTWWYLQAPYDEKRSGWAASKYLVVIKVSP
jgi:hypothetical protein